METDRSNTAQSAPELLSQLEALYPLAAPTWPLASAVACNPLQGLEHLPFHEAIRKGEEFFDADCLPGFWQLRQARKKGQLSEQDFQDAIAQALDHAPPVIQLEDQEVELRPLLVAMVQELDDARKAAFTSPLLHRAYSNQIGIRPWMATLPTINQQAIVWLGAFLDEGQAAWSMPYRDHGFFPAVKKLLAHDRQFTASRSFLKELPDDSLSALKELLDNLSISGGQREDFLRDHLLALPGWAAFIRWRSEQEDYQPQQKYPISLTDYLAVRLLFACLLPEKAHKNQLEAPREWCRLSAWAETQLAPLPETDADQWAELLNHLQNAYQNIRLELLERWETHFRRQLGHQLQSQIRQSPVMHRPEAQLAFCIDVRSEPFRRQLEAAGAYETFGFAGFFGLPIAYQTLLGKRVKSLPVLLQPVHELREQAAPGCAHHEKRHQSGLRLIQELKQAYKSLKYNLATPFAAVEALGLPAALITAGRSLLPQTLIRLRREGRKLFRPEIDLVPNIMPTDDWGISLQHQVTYAGNALQMMGLTSNFAPLVVLCGHGSQTENNPYAAALDCGACGGSHGGPNAVAMASILNQPVVRRHLSDQGIRIPEDTLFLGAQHNTTTDGVSLLALPDLSAEKQKQVAALRIGLQKAQESNLAARAVQFGKKNGPSMLRRSTDWSEVRPEWGLAGNAGFVVAPRHLTAKLDLRGRCFLHSYDWQQDPESSSLEVILTAPLVVAQWINSQYFFSTVDNVAFGSGSKITHNVAGKFGIMQGNGSDLMHGLPLQSVMKSDQELYHQPLRLAAFVVAPRARVQALIDKHAILQQMFFNKWVVMQVFDPEEEKMWRLEASGQWVVLDSQ